MKLAFSYLAAIYLAILVVLGLLFVLMSVSDPGSFESAGEMIGMLAFGGSIIIIGLAGTYGLRGVYRKHRRFSKVAGGTASFLAAVLGMSGIIIAATTSRSQSMQELIL